MIRSLFERRVPHILGLYLGGAWVVVEFVSFLAERYLLTDTLTDFVLVTLLSMLPAVAVVAWFHGTPGKDEWVTTEKVVVPVNAILTIVLLSVMFRGEELGATTTTITATDEQGATVTRLAPKDSFRKSLAIFPFANESGDAGLDWMQYAAAELLKRDLEQNAYISGWSPLEGFEQSGLLDMQRAGFHRAVGVPVSLMRTIAAGRDLPLLLTGQFDAGNGAVSIVARLYETDRGGEPRTFRSQGPTLAAATDVLSRAIRDALELPAGADALGPDLPVAEHFSASMEALRLYAEALTASAIDNDVTRAIELLRAAREADPAFAAAHLKRATLAANNGQTAAAREAIAEADQHAYRLLPEEKFRLKALRYYARDEVPKMLSVYEMHSELYPDDVDALATLAFAYLFRSNEIDKAFDTFAKIHRKDPSASWALLQMAQLHLVRGETERARELLLHYAADRPEEYLPLLRLAQIHIEAGELDHARGYLERAVLITSGRVDPILALAELERREGRFEQAVARIEEAREVAAVPRQHSAVLEAELKLLGQRAQAGRIGERLDELYDTDSSFRGPINLMMTTLSDQVAHYILADRQQVYLERLAALAQRLEPPIDQLAEVGYLVLYLETGDVEKAEHHAREVRSLVERFGRDDLQYLNDLAEARIRELKGDFDGAVGAAEASLARFAESVHRVQVEEDQIRIRNMLGEYRFRAGDYEGAQAVLEEVLKAFPAHPVTNLVLAELAYARGEHGTAMSHLAVSLACWVQAPPDYAPAQRARALAVQLEASS